MWISFNPIVTYLRLVLLCSPNSVKKLSFHDSLSHLLNMQTVSDCTCLFGVACARMRSTYQLTRYIFVTEIVCFVKRSTCCWRLVALQISSPAAAWNPVSYVNQRKTLFLTIWQMMHDGYLFWVERLIDAKWVKIVKMKAVLACDRKQTVSNQVARKWYMSENNKKLSTSWADLSWLCHSNCC